MFCSKGMDTRYIHLKKIKVPLFLPNLRIVGLVSHSLVHNIFYELHELIRETVPAPTSDMRKKTLSVLAHSFLLPKRPILGNIFSIAPMRYSRR